MKSALLVVLLAAAATAEVISNEVPDVDQVADVDVDEISEVFVTDVDELTDEAQLFDEIEQPMQTAVDSRRRNLNLGNITDEDIVVYDEVFQLDGIPGVSMMRSYLANARRPITAIRVTCLSASQTAIPGVTHGGLGNIFALITIQTAVGLGFHYRIQVYVRQFA
ncbi:hypothetical protein PYW07_009518 [Mythimna separata]|uniref:Uncharacterized protein n=1 Tax=Mythimna separata TaxID=271217 RepID=A0AAD8DND6_MYTSE|nr:hypothetical protein PYW07_009518 [Mythimna separata]